MNKIRKATFAALAVSMLAGGAGTAGAQDRWDWGGGRAGDRDYGLRGAGVGLLYPELRRTNRGRAFVMRNFDRNRDGFINPREARAANRAFATGSTGKPATGSAAATGSSSSRKAAAGTARRCAAMASARPGSARR